MLACRESDENLEGFRETEDKWSGHDVDCRAHLAWNSLRC